MSTIMTASRQWASRPDDERFISLDTLHAHCTHLRDHSRGKVVSSRHLQIQPDPQDESKGLLVVGPEGQGYAPSNWAFGQLATVAEAPAGYMRSLDARLAADCLNYGLLKRSIEDVGVLIRKPNGEQGELAAVTGPRYGRVWNSDITYQLTDRFGDGINGDWRVPGEFGHAVQVTKANTTIYASDRDMFVFLADEINRIHLPNRREGRQGSLARGFFVWNSEVGAATFGVAMFLFDYVCCNRIIWGAEGYREIKIRHTVSAPDRWLEQVVPVIADLHDSSPKPIEETLQAAQKAKIDDIEDFLTKRRFTRPTIRKVTETFQIEEKREIETIWDATTAITAYAKTIPFQDERVALERQGGELLELVAN